MSERGSGAQPGPDQALAELERLRLENAALRAERDRALAVVPPAAGRSKQRLAKATLVILSLVLLGGLVLYRQLPQRGQPAAQDPAAAPARPTASQVAVSHQAERLRPGKDLLLTLPVQELDHLRTAALAPGGDIVATGGGDGQIGLYRLADGKLLRLLSAHRGQVSALAFSPDGGSLVSAGADGALAVWAVESGKLRRRLCSGGTPLWSVAVSREWVAVAGQQPTILLYPLAGGKSVSLAGHEDWVRTVTFSPDGRRLASGGLDTSVRLWEVKSRRQLQRLAGHRLWVNALAFSPDGKLLASAGLERQIVIWELASGEVLARLGGHVREATALAFSPGGQLLASASLDRTVRVWDVQKERTLHRLTGHRWQVSSVAFAPDGSFLLSASGDGKLRLWPLPPPLPPGAAPLPPPGPGELTLRNNTSGERLRLRLLDGERLLPAGLAALSHFLRCGTDDAVGQVDPQLARLLYRVADHFGREHEIQVISGYRSPRYNALRRRQSQEVAKESLHLEGKAIDFRLAGVTITALQRYVKKLRAGGVGFYADSQFVHMDVGPVRSWGGD